MSAPLSVDIWLDFACPWCFIGQSRFHAALEGFTEAPVRLRLHSYLLARDMAPDHRESHESFLRGKFGWDKERYLQSNAQLSALGAPLGAVFNFDKAVVSSTALAHQMLQFALPHGRQAQVSLALMRAYFTEGRVLGDLETLVEIGAEQGLPPDALRKALTSGDYAPAVAEDLDHAEQIGVSGVPFFVLDQKYAISGAQDVEVLRQSFRQVAQMEKGA